MRRRINYANVTATLALIFAMSGGALAASHYLISSTKQISPKVLKALKGRAGKTGATGPEGPAGKAGSTGGTGATGATGATGFEGSEGKPGKQGPEGEKGEKGTTGLMGPSEAYEEKSLTSTGITSKVSDTISVSLLAGSYDISAKAQVKNEEAVSGTVLCELKPEGEPALDEMTSALPAKGTTPGEATAVLHSKFEKAGATTVSFTCSLSAGPAKEVLVIHPALSAIKVATLH